MQIQHTTLNGAYSQKVHFRTHHYAINENIRMSINETGYVGIGTENPAYPLDIIRAGPTPAGIGSGGTIMYGGPGWSGGFSQTCLRTINSIWCQGGDVFVTSDTRIKNNIVELEDNEALLKFRQLKPCKYNYIDTFYRTSDKVYGFIAQEVKEVMPYATQIAATNECIPNIYKVALYNNNIIQQLYLTMRRLQKYFQ